MPIYEYDCPECGDSFEKLVRDTSGKTQVVCPHCGGVKVKRKLSMFASSMKGGSSAPASDCSSPGGT
jgi:putative FmdB family regulatory protein